jgi:hypothetical protein
MDFSVSVKAFAEMTSKKLLDIKKEAAVEVANRVIERSPVGDPALWKTKPPKGYVGGQFKANWVAANGSVDSSTTNAIDPSGQLTKDTVKSSIDGAIDQQDIYISNSLPYAVELENGHSTQAPAGMVGITAVEFDSIVKEMISNERS